MEKKRIFGRGIYESKDVPIRLLDGMIFLVIVVIVILILVFGVFGGYRVTFDTDGGSTIESQTLRHGKHVVMPPQPVKAGYEFIDWMTSTDETDRQSWNFTADVVQQDMTLYALWEPAKVKVRFDLSGGEFQDSSISDTALVTYGSTYGTIPVPQKDGYTFDGWEYSGTIIKEDTIVSVNGEHILTALWKENQ